MPSSWIQELAALQTRIAREAPEGVTLDAPIIPLGQRGALYKRLFQESHPPLVFLVTLTGQPEGDALSGMPLLDQTTLQAWGYLPENGPPKSDEACQFWAEVIQRFGGPTRFFRYVYPLHLIPWHLAPGQGESPLAEPQLVEAAWKTFQAQLALIKPRHVIAVGKEVEEFLKPRLTLMPLSQLPHPARYEGQKRVDLLVHDLNHLRDLVADASPSPWDHLSDLIRKQGSEPDIRPGKSRISFWFNQQRYLTQLGSKWLFCNLPLVAFKKIDPQGVTSYAPQKGEEAIGSLVVETPEQEAQLRGILDRLVAYLIRHTKPLG